MSNDISPLKELYDFVKILFAVLLTLALVIFTITFSILAAYKVLEALS